MSLAGMRNYFLCFLWLCIKYSWLRPDQLSLFADGGNDTKVIRLSRTRAAALNTEYWVSSLSLLLSALSLFSEYRISPNKWQIVPDYLDSGMANNRASIRCHLLLCVVTLNIILWMPPRRRRGWHGWAGPGGAMRDARVIETRGTGGEGTRSWQMDGVQSLHYVTHSRAEHCQPDHTQRNGEENHWIDTENCIEIVAWLSGYQ